MGRIVLGFAYKFDLQIGPIHQFEDACLELIQLFYFRNQ